MDELDLLKQDWHKEKPNEFKTYSEKELFAMTKKKSVSVAKWIFITALCEIIFWIFLKHFSFSNDDHKTITQFINDFGLIAEFIIKILTLISAFIPILFLGILIHTNIKIRLTENPKILMKKILLMRNSVKWYIRLLLAQIIIGFFLGLVAGINENKDDINEKDYPLILLSVIFTIVLSFIFTLFIRFIYHLIYGNLIHRLESNYKELSKIEENA